MFYVKEMSKNIYQDELASLSSKVNEFSFKAPPTSKSLEETGLIDNPPIYSANNYLELLKKYWVYFLIPIFVFVLLYITKPYFVNVKSVNDDGEELTLLSYKNLGLYTILTSLPLIVVYHIYIKKQS